MKAHYKQIPADRFTPITCYEALAQAGGAMCLLDSCGSSKEMDRYSFIGLNPRIQFEAQDSVAYVNGDSVEGNPYDVLRAIIAETKVDSDDDLPPFVGGAIGYFGYDSIRLFEAIPDRHPKDEDIPEIALTFYDTIVAFDHQKLQLTVTHLAQKDDGTIDGIIDQIVSYSAPAPKEISTGQVKVETDIDDAGFAQMVEQAKEEILAGEVFQVVLSRKFQTKYTVSPLAIYRALRMVSPSPYMFFLDYGKFAVAGASPERLVRLKGEGLETMPLAGTRPRGEGIRDQELAEELAADPKECAEHMMLVDLGRNDLGKIAKVGSVAVPELKKVVRFSHVMHLSSTVTAEIDPRYDGLDAIAATMPMGTLSGAPKVRAMQLIDQLENSRRGIYGGAICYLSANGDMDSCIAIRMAVLKDGVATVRAGAGVVADSVPEKEAEETRQKARGILKAIELAEGVL